MYKSLNTSLNNIHCLYKHLSARDVCDGHELEFSETDRHLLNSALFLTLKCKKYLKSKQEVLIVLGKQTKYGKHW